MDVYDFQDTSHVWKCPFCCKRLQKVAIHRRLHSFVALPSVWLRLYIIIIVCCNIFVYVAIIPYVIDLFATIWYITIIPGKQETEVRK